MVNRERDIAQICLNGHLITGKALRHPEYQKKFCDKCGAKTVVTCPNCNENIPGSLRNLGMSRVPKYCVHCGKPFPWTEKAISAANEMLELMEGLPSADKEELKREIPEMVSDNPRTKVAATKVGKILDKIGGIVADQIRSLLVDIASETAKKIITGS